jgi:hypothetical protein
LIDIKKCFGTRRVLDDQSRMKEKYKYVKNFLDPALVDFASSWMLLTYGNMSPDKDVPNSPAMHAAYDHLLQNFLFYCLPRMEKETNLQLKPIYAYTRLYRPGAVLPKHVDRSQSEYSVTITMKYSYQNKNYKWPICMYDMPVIIESGDGVIYKGCEVPHWRPQFKEHPSSWHHQMHLHYVNRNGPYKNVSFENDIQALRKVLKEKLSPEFLHNLVSDSTWISKCEGCGNSIEDCIKSDSCHSSIKYNEDGTVETDKIIKIK